MAHTITLVADHLGTTAPYVVGHKYEVVADLGLAGYRGAGVASAASQTITAATPANTFTRGAGSYLTDGFAVGDYITVLGSDAGNNAQWMRIEAVTATVITVTDSLTIAADTGDADEQVLHVGEKLLASSFGLSTIDSVSVSSSTDQNVEVSFVIASDKSFVHLYARNAGGAFSVAGGKAADTDLGTLRLLVKGQL